MQEGALELKDVIEMLKRRFLLIVGFFLVCLLSAVCYDLLSASRYESAAIIRISRPPGYLQSFAATTQLADNSKRLMSTYAELAYSRAVIQQVIAKTHSQYSYEEMGKNISAQILGDSEMVSLKVVDKSPEQAKAVLTVLVDVLTDRLDVGEAITQQSLRERIQEAQGEQVATETALRQYTETNTGTGINDSTYLRLVLEVKLANAVLGRLMREYEDIRVNGMVQSVLIKVVDPPSQPEKPLEAKTKYRRWAVAGILGLLCGVFFALLIECSRKSAGGTPTHTNITNSGNDI